MRFLLILLFMVGAAVAATPFDIIKGTNHDAHPVVELAGLNATAAVKIAEMNEPLGPSHYVWDTVHINQGKDDTATPAMINFTNST